MQWDITACPIWAVIQIPNAVDMVEALLKDHPISQTGGLSIQVAFGYRPLRKTICISFKTGGLSRKDSLYMYMPEKFLSSFNTSPY